MNVVFWQVYQIMMGYEWCSEDEKDESEKKNITDNDGIWMMLRRWILHKHKKAGGKQTRGDLVFTHTNYQWFQKFWNSPPKAAEKKSGISETLIKTLVASMGYRLRKYFCHCCKDMWRRLRKCFCRCSKDILTVVWGNAFALYAAGNCDSLLRKNALVIVTHSGNAFYVSITCILEVAIIKRHFAVLGAKNTIMLYTFKNRLYWKIRSVICRLPPEL